MYDPTNVTRARSIIRRGFASMLAELSQLEQSPHNCSHPTTIDALLKTVKKAWDEPRPFTVSDAVQTIQRFLDAEPS